MTTCKYPGCDKQPGQEDRDDYRNHKFCSVMHELKYEHVRAESKEARSVAMEER